MLEDATPRAQLHLQRILNEFREHLNGPTARARSSTGRSSPLRHAAAARVPALVGSPSGSSAQPADAHNCHFAAGVVLQQRSRSAGHAAAAKGSVSPPRRKPATLPTYVRPAPYLVDAPATSPEHDAPRRETHKQSATVPIQRLARVGRVRAMVARESASRETRAGDVIVREGSGELAKAKKLCVRQIESEEMFYRQFICKVVDAYTEVLWHVKRCGEEAAKQSMELTDMVARVVRFASTSTEEVLQDREEHLSRVMKPASSEPLMDFKEALRSLQRLPTILAANYSHLVSTAHGTAEAEYPTNLASAPPPLPQQPLQQQQPQNTTAHDANLFVRRPSSLLSRRGSLQAMASLSYPSRGGFVSPYAGLLTNESLDCVDDTRSTSTPVANMVMPQRGRDVDPAWVVEDLQEENVYWQEEALRAALEAERYSQMLHTVLTLPPESPPNERNDVAPRRMSITATGSPSQKVLLQRLFIRLILEKEEGERGRIESREAQEWWLLWFAAKDAVTHRPGTSKENGKAVNNHHQKEEELGKEGAHNGSRSPPEEASDATHS
ncbi:uncharacterized protein Tco025E_05895 [Trypanosoma conorhini]|uniref:Uncharacterized protein n=1 Tax=Trypanosoma conorhini TaxID=83891 RepID=A0A3S5ISZ4_9TRYP|nr:uncharacterized protein Tco025E_05895 [Trypanosoma conorhini]RNF14327.1 hypothetical protein Tco025E_05895 [Trypanosoma conorhini]